MTERVRFRPYWLDFTDGSGTWRSFDRTPPGEDLAALRRGAGREPGTVPSMWEFHHKAVDDEWLAEHRLTWETPPDYQAEHHALILFGFHQQSVRHPMHVDGVGLGTAMLRLRQSPKGGEAIDRRFATSIGATALAELAQHLRRVVALLNDIRQPLDYSRLLHQLIWWQRPGGQNRVRRTWGLEYYAPPRQQVGHDAAPEPVAQ